ncbi:H(+)-transporting ATPase F(1) gamma subunit [Amylolactobacillus amylotrophicus DSM 20534]|uniref:ATP synthase gamma chain n=3 Tax=Amylolactobacillus TaxID=2767876 RepID=A0A0R1YP79_9LACO|nr:MULTISPECIES: F0F1 ATP synthase subunit gamma [Amylolactobacillus]APT19068.1 F0F1 ATP synthase subunit gamma [Amylolactobacillus amylophilus DSM 20533 = JCM 1125]KRK38665.1 H(+)-transporting ATPase F(1) gamma subunit [Amylolactobacillus amylotrophicus DSM 20534]KRM42692.1 H(+)-transporting ATPase F(1) gamma subunit [Amylolactobacillus amylophilus DSM 20533 = JCM 1125]GED79551.1 ATP synthase gamma chain [Amylolactobacillus amylophilus]
MAESLLELKRKITSTQKTGQITSAMQMVSGVKLSQTEKLDKGYTVYNDKIRATVTHLMASEVFNQLKNREDFDGDYSEIDITDLFDLGNLNVLIKPRAEIKKVGYLVITGDRGLVGSYNSSIIKNMMSLVQNARDRGREPEILAVGSIGAQFFKKQDINVVYEYRGISDVPSFNEVREIVTTAVNMYLNGVYDELYVCYTHHVNTISSQFRAEKMLPISDIDITEAVDDDQPTGRVDYLTEPSLDSVLQAILPQFAQSMIFGAILDAKTAEHASSMTAMDNATKNAKDVVSSLTTKLNRARQAQITTEITEIIGGAAALE